MAWIYQAASMGEAHIRAAIVDSQGRADLCVYLVSSPGMASGDALWFVDKSKESARTWVYFAGLGMAQIRVYFVKDRGLAGWQVQHPLQGKFR